MWTEIQDEEAILAKVLEESLRHYNEVEIPRSQATKRINEEPIHNKRQEADIFAQPSTSKQSNYGQQSNFRQMPAEQKSSTSCESPEKKELYVGEEAEGFDLQAGKTWLYPTNYPIRQYQRSIVSTALFHNTLVSLPTGLGKTFIAAVVMYNFYQWYPKGKIIFMAPTKPLVAQQVEHCYNTMGIPKQDTAEMTGALPSKDRSALWRCKRVFFLTPQVVQNDLSSGICPATAVKCIVIDEAHRATGEYAYCQVVKLLQSFGAKFRVLALSATPGSDITAVQKVVSSLMISHIEIRNEDSPDLAAYTHERKIEIMSVSVGPTILQIREKYLRIMGEYCRKLQASKVLFGNVVSLSSFQILKSWNEFRMSPPPGMPADTVRVLSADFSLLHSLAHGLDLLQNYGLRLLLTNITDVIEDPTNPSGARLKKNIELQELLEEVRNILDPPPDSTLAPSQPEFIYGHPKLDALKDVVENHFKDFEARGVQTRVIVFCEYREAVIEIRQLLTALEPLVKPVGFMGQSSGKHGKGISQKNQLLVMEQFRKGVYNTLVSTSVGEEGLDIGEVDLIICYDAKNSPIRQVQRMGRTGRKRKGRIIVLVTEGKEEMKFRSALAKKKNINAMLVERDSLKGYLLDESPSMLPEGFHTECVERNVVIAPSTASLQQQDLRKMFSRKTSNNAGNMATATSAENAYLPDEVLNEMLPEAMEDIRKAQEIYKNLDLSRYLEWQRYLQFTHEVDHSTTAEMMVDLLAGSLEKEGNNFQGLQSQITATQIWPGVKRRGAKRSAAAGAGAGVGKRKKPRTNTDKKPQRASSPASSESSVDGPMPSYFQAKPGRANLPPASPTASTTHEPDDIIPLDIDMPLEQSPSPLEMEDDSDDCDLHPVIREALKKLGRAFRKKDDDSMSEDDFCAVCAHLEPCPGMKKMMEEDVPKPDLNWDQMEAMLNRAKSILPRLTKDSFSLPTPPESPVFVSMIPRELNDGIICGGVGDVPASPEQTEVVKYHSDASFSNTSGTDHPNERSHNASVTSAPPDAKVFELHVGSSPGMDHFGYGALLDEHLDDIFANIESQKCRNDEKSSPTKEDELTSPILGSQLIRKSRSSQATPTPKSNPRRSLLANFESPKAASNSKKAVSPSKVSSQRDIQLDFESFLLPGTQSPEEKSPSIDQNGLSPVLSKSQAKPKQKEQVKKEGRAKTPVKGKEMESPRIGSNCLSSVASKTGPREEVGKEYEAFFEQSEDDIFAGLDIESDVFNVSNTQKLDLNCGFMNKPEETLEKENVTPRGAKTFRGSVTPRKEGISRTEETCRKEENLRGEDTHPTVHKEDVPGRSLAELVWMDKFNGSIVASLAPPQSKKTSKLSLKRSAKTSKSNSILGKFSMNFDREERVEPLDLPDCFRPKKSQTKPVNKTQPIEEVVCVSTDDDDFTRRIAELPLSPIPKPDLCDRPATPNAQLDELIRNLPTVSSDSSPEVYHLESPVRGKRKRVLSSPASPEVPRKRQNVVAESSPESPLFVKPKKGSRRPLDETVLESQRLNLLEQSLQVPVSVKPKSGSRRLLDESVAGSSGWLQAKDSKRKPENITAGKPSKRISSPESPDDEFIGARPAKETSTQRLKKTKGQKKPKKKKKKSSKFLLSQAVESEDECRDSSDGESTSLDELDSSFIDDSPNETVAGNDVDVQARYLQAVRSPAVKPNAFKIPHPSEMPFRGDIYSQAVDHNDYSCYMNDSFCVDEDLEERSSPEMSLLEIAEARLKAEKKERRNKVKKREPKKRSRIVRPIDSSESEDDIQIIAESNENKANDAKVTSSKLVNIDTNIVDEWYDDDFDVPEINLAAAENFNKQTSTSKPSTSSTSIPEPAPVRRLGTDDISNLLDDDFDFGEVDAVEGKGEGEEPAQSDFVVPKAKSKCSASSTSSVRNGPLVIFVSVRQAASAVEILRLLRISHKITPSCRSSTKADYIVSRRVGVCRIALSDLKSNDKLQPIVSRLKESFARPILIVENDKENRLLMATKNFKNKGNVPPPKPVQPEWTSGAITTLNQLREAQVEVLFSDEKALTARLLASLTKAEQDAGCCIPPIPEEFSNEMERKLKFLTTIPGINIALAVHLIEKFKTIKSFISNCSKVKDIQRNVEVNHLTAQKIYNILQQVHIS